MAKGEICTVTILHSIDPNGDRLKQPRLGILRKMETNITAASAEVCLVSYQVELTLTTLFKDALSSEGPGDFCLGSSRFMEGKRISQE